MSNNANSKQDRDLLSRLNALKKSTIDLDEKKFVVLFSFVAVYFYRPDPTADRAFQVQSTTDWFCYG